MQHIVYRGQKYEVIGIEKFTRPELSLIKKHTGMTPGDLVRGLPKFDLDAIAGVLLVLRKRAGEKATWADFDDLTMDDVDFIRDDEGDGGEAEASGDDEQDDDDETDDERPDPT